MKSFIQKLFIGISIFFLCPFSVFAGEITNTIDITDSVEIVDAETTEEVIEDNIARVNVSPRGEWLGDVVLEISNPQNGNIGVLMTTSCNISVDEILMGLFVDKLNDDQTSSQVDYKIFQILPEDFPDGILVDAIIDIELTGFEPGWYRLRGLHRVRVGEDSEIFSTETRFIEITKRFPFSADEDEATPAEASDSQVPDEDELPTEAPEAEKESSTPSLATPSELPEQ